MFFSRLFQRKLISLLRPWLSQEPQLHLKLGFFNSIIVVKNLNFDASNLNALIDDNSQELSLLFRTVTVDEVIVRVSHWCAPAFTVEVNGVNVTLFLEKRVVIRVDESVEGYLEERKKKILAKIDADGSMLHDNIEKMLMTTSSRSKLKDSIMNLLLMHCFLCLHDVRIRVEFPVSDENFSWVCYSQELNAQSSHKTLGCLLGGFVGLLFLPLRETSFNLEASKLEIGSEKKDYSSCILSCVNPYFDIRMKDLSLVNSALSFLEINFSFSPTQLEMMGAFNNMLKIECKHVRSGRLLWGIARWKIHHSLLLHRCMLYSLTLIAILWLRLVKEYHSFLILIGYTEHGVKMPNGCNFSSQAEQQQKKILQLIEKELPAEVIASARRVARCRAALNDPHAEDIAVSPITTDSDKFWRIILPLAYTWQAMVKISKFIAIIFLLLKKSPKVNKRKMGFEVADPRFCFHLSLGKFLAVFSSTDVSCPPGQKNSNLRKRSYMDAFSLYLSVKNILFIHEEGIFEQYVSFTLGSLEVTSAPYDSKTESRPENVGGFYKGQLKERLDGVETIVWGEPALTGCHLEDGDIGHGDVPILDHFAGDMELFWKRLQVKFQGSKGNYDRNPWVLCVIHTFWVYPGLKSPDLGFSKCDLMVGRLSIALRHSSAASIVALSKKVHYALCQDYGSESAVVQLHSSRILEESGKASWSGGLKSSMKAMMSSILNLLPEKHVELRAVVVGPRVQISLRNEELSSNNLEPTSTYVREGVNLTMDIFNIEFAIWPTAKSEVAQRPDNLESEFSKLEEPVLEKIFGSVDLRYASKGQIMQGCYLKIDGLKAYFEDVVDNHLMQILLLKPTTAKLSSLRDYQYSFARSVMASSLSLRGAMAGVSGSFYMDELSVINRVVESLFSAASTHVRGLSGVHAAQNDLVPSKNLFLQSGPLDQELSILVENEADLCSESAYCFISASFELVPFDIIFHNTRNGIDREYFSMLFDAYNIQNLGLAEFPSCGIWLSIQKICTDVSVGESKAEANANFDGFQAIMFTYKKQAGKVDQSEVENASVSTVDCLHEVSFSNFTFNLLLDCLSDSGVRSGADIETRNQNFKSVPHFSSSIIDVEGLNLLRTKEDNSESQVSTVMPTYLLLLKITVDVIFMGSCSIKSEFPWSRQVDKLCLSLLVADFQSIVFGIQGGHIFIEATVVAEFSRCLTSYLQYIRSLLMDYQHTNSRETAEGGSNVLGEARIEDSTQAMTPLASSVKPQLLEALSINVSQLSLILLVTDETKVVKEITGSISLNVKLWLEDRKKKLLFNVSNLDILSMIQNEVESEKNIQLPHFSSVGSSHDSLWLSQEDSVGAVPQGERDARGASSLASAESSFVNNSASPVVQSSERRSNYILKCLAISISAERPFSGDNSSPSCPTQGWVGDGSVTGLNLTISLSQIQTLLSAIESLSEVFGKGVTNDLEERSWMSHVHEPEIDLQAALPDGAIVAIQDAHQHLYITVESVENKYKLSGAIHYSLAGKKALFRVKWQRRRLWNFSTSWFSLTSLHAKSDSGTPLRLNYTRSSDFVDIASNNDNTCALWKISKSEVYKDDVDLDPLNHLFKRNFYLVNKKNDCGAAFVHGTLEFVKKPGNPFMFKVFHSLPLVPDLRTPETHLPEAPGLALLDGQDIFEEAGIVPSISLRIEKVSVVIVHELSDPKDNLPLLQATVDVTELKIQMLPQKIRVISTLSVMLYYFDVHRAIWREFVQPIEMYLYWRSTSSSLATELKNHGMHSRLYFRMQELDLSLTEYLLDMILYMVGKLDLAGPFAVKNAAVLGNCCKVENQSNIDLICHFGDTQSTRVGRRQSTFIFMRHLDPETSYATILLENPGISSTSPVHIPISRTRLFAWRTRIMSQQDSRNCPGPFIVFDISKNAEEGLSLEVSPLLRIHNNTGFPVELRIKRPESTKAESASVVLKEGDAVDDCMAAFDAISLSAGPKKALLSLGVGNFVFAFRPDIKEEIEPCRSCSVEWSEDLKGEKAVRLSGVIDKLSYQVRKAFSSESWTYSFSTAACSVKSGDAEMAQMHFLVQSIARDVPIMQPKNHCKSKNSSIALLEQKEIFLLPTVRVSNLLKSDIDVHLSETEISTIDGTKNINRASIQCGSTSDLYANPAVIFFNVTLAMFSSSCKPVNCSQWFKKLNKKDGIQFLDIDLEFCGGMYYACLRLARGNRGMLEAVVFTQYTLRNDTEFLLFCSAPHLKPISRDEAERYAVTTPQFGTLLPSKSSGSWFMKSSKLSMKLLDEESSKSILDLDVLSGLAEINFTKLEGSGLKHLVKLGISLGPLTSEIDVPARLVSVVPRYIISNDSDEQIFVRQCSLEDDFGETLRISSKEKKALFFRVGSRVKRDVSVLNKLLQKHKVSDDDSSIFLQFSPNETVWGWSGPVCVASLGCFFLKFKRQVEFPVHQLDLVRREDNLTWEFAAVHVVEEGSTFVLHFHRPPNTSLPYRLENHLHDASISYYQKDAYQQESLASGGSVNYVWDDLTRPHKLMVKINGTHMLREISLDKLRPWKSFFRVRKDRDLASYFPVSRDTRVSDRGGTDIGQLNGIDVENVGFEVYVDGPTRVLRISHSPGGRKANSKYQSCMKLQLRISYFAIHLLEPCKQNLEEDVDPYDLSTYKPIIIGRLENVSIDSINIDQRKYNQIRVLSLDIDERWIGAPFAALCRRHVTSNTFTDDSILFVVFVLFPSTSSIRNVRYSSIILQPIDLNLDEETLMKIVPFWRTSLSSNTQSQHYYFDHFEILPVKITANFLPVDSYSNYSSGQEALRSLLHGVIKIPAIKNLEVELNGVMVSHALVTTRELMLRCARHYSWYGMRAIYIAKGSPLLPPAFASVFDDLASSSLDVFFDPSSSLFNVPGLTVGTFKLIRKCIEDKGFSGTKRYFGDLSKTLKNAGSNILFAAVTEVTDSVLKGAESSGFNGMVSGFHHGILRLAMEPSLLGTALLEGGPDRRIKLDRSPGIDEMYVEGYLQAMLDTIYKQEYLRVRVVDDQVILKNLPPNSSLIDEIMERVKDFLLSKALLKGDYSTSSRPLRHLRGENEWRIGPTVLTLCEHLFVSFAIRMLRKQTSKAMGKFRLTEKWAHKVGGSHSSSSGGATSEVPKGKSIWRRGIGKFALSALVAYVDGRLCRCIPNPVARRIVSGFLLSFLDSNDSK